MYLSENGEVTASFGQGIRSRPRRNSVSSEAIQPSSSLDYDPPIYEKSDAERLQIKEALQSDRNDVLFGHLGTAENEQVVGAFHRKDVPSGQAVILQGDEGDYFYIVEKGRFDITVEENGALEKVETAESGDSFGELALMYNAPRAATCRAAVDSSVWALDRETFHMMCITLENKKKKRYEMLLKAAPICRELHPCDFLRLADLLTQQWFDDN
eukprot:Selendium_serpulae@DN6402_c0_g1_i3.p1